LLTSDDVTAGGDDSEPFRLRYGLPATHGYLPSRTDHLRGLPATIGIATLAAALSLATSGGNLPVTVATGPRGHVAPWPRGPVSHGPWSRGPLAS